MSIREKRREYVPNDGGEVTHCRSVGTYTPWPRHETNSNCECTLGGLLIILQRTTTLAAGKYSSLLAC